MIGGEKLVIKNVLERRLHRQELMDLYAVQQLRQF